MLESAYKNCYGLWKVTTEGDCEGRSVRDLGTYEGYIDEIAFALADKCYYELTFHAVKKPSKLDMTPKAKEVKIQLDIDSGSWDLTQTQCLNETRKLFENRPVRVTEAHGWGVVTLKTELKTIEEKRQEALAKLTDEERQLLGL